MWYRIKLTNRYGNDGNNEKRYDESFYKTRL